MKYPFSVARGMEVEGIDIELPTLAANPFSTLPLEASQSHLLVGRVPLKTALQQYIRFMSSRRILLSGEMGSGRSSLLRCLSNHAPVSVHIDHIPHQQPGLGLLREVYFQLTRVEGPSGWTQVVEKLVDASRAYKDSLPLIVIDAQGVEMSLLSEALRSSGAALNRIQCVLVVVLETSQKALFPEKMLHMFDSSHHLKPFTIDEIQALVESRVGSVTGEDFVLSQEDARHLLNKTNGNPGAIIKTLRNAVDASRDPSSLAGINQILSMPPAVEVSTDQGKPLPLSTLQEEASDEKEAINASESASEGIAESPAPLGGLGDETTPEVNEDPFDSAIIDASMPWEERESHRDVADDVKILDSIQGFELNLEQLDEEKSSDAELPEIPFKALPQTPEYDSLDQETPPPLPSGMFSSIVGRIREVKKSPPPAEESGAELWVHEGSEPLPLAPNLSEDEALQVPENESFAELIHDEIGLYEEPQEASESVPFLPQESPVPSFESHESSSTEVLALTQAVHALVSALGSDGISNPASSQRAFIDALALLQKKPISNPTEHHLEVGLLSSLTANEMAVMAVAQQRKFSPSDAELLADLGVKRSRLSQICNRLHKGGILSVRQQGRSRFFTMTSTAKAQLGAWGTLGGEA